MTRHLVVQRDLVCTLPGPGWNYGHTRSPFYPHAVAEGATFVVYNRRMMPVSMTNADRFQAYWALRKGVVRLDTGELPTEFRGPDAERLLNRLFTRDVSRMKPGRSAYGVACWPDGGILVDGILVRLEEDRFWYVQADGDFVGWARAHALGLDVEITDPRSWVHQIQGPKAFDVLAEACDDGMPEPFRYFDAREVTMGGQTVLITRTGWTAELGFEVYTRPGMDDDALWAHISAAGAKHGMLDIGLDGMDIRRIEGAIFNNISDIDHTTSAWAAGFGPFLKFGKGDFFGSDALQAMTDRRTCMYGITCKAAEPLAGGPVARDGRKIGHITASGWSPYLEQGVAFVRLSSADDLAPRSCEVMGFDGAMHPARIVDLPFYDAEKKIPRGLEVASWD
ncbi:MAG: aminomethyl transferase family protein [Rhodospirillales bacterium]|nr:aminomethyl transferase family protein [Rhodospirillales bacterium]